MISSSPRRVVITGIGLISPLGNSKEQLWESLDTGTSGVGPLQNVPPDFFPFSFAAEALDFTGHINDFGPLTKEQKKAIRKGLRVMCRECQMGVAAAQLALKDAGIELGSFDPERAGVIFGSDYMLTRPEDFISSVSLTRNGGAVDFSRWATEGMPQVAPLWLLKYLPNMPASHIAIFNDMRGPNNSITIREASANLAIGEAFRIIARDDADLLLAGSTGTRVHPMRTVQATLQEELATDISSGPKPTEASRPFDLNRTGMVLGEGCGTLVLEELSSAISRGATILGEVVGTASSSVLDRNSVAQLDVALANAMRATLRDAGVDLNDSNWPKQVGHIHAHGLSTRSSDIQEARAIREVFGDQADLIPVTAAKSYFGNLGAGSGVIELAASLLAFKHERLFPVLNYETPDPECRLNITESTTTNQRSVPANPGKSVLNLNFSPQGQASAVMVRAWDGI